MEPTLLLREPRIPPAGNAITRGLRAFLIERRLPYSLERFISKSLKAIGLEARTMRVGDYAVRCRRATTDELVVQSVMVNEEYFRFHEEFRPTAGQTVIDIGANIGTFALSASKYVGNSGRILCVEPHPANLRYLKRNIERNKLRRVTIVEGAISSSCASMQLFVARESGHHSLLIDHGRGSITVPTYTLDELMRRFDIESCDLLKVDCEGGEFDFLPSVKPETWRRVKRIAMEYSVPARDITSGPTAERRARKHAISDKLIEILVSNGFRIDGYYDCDGARAGYIFATLNSLPNSPRSAASN